MQRLDRYVLTIVGLEPARRAGLESATLRFEPEAQQREIVTEPLPVTTGDWLAALDDFRKWLIREAA